MNLSAKFPIILLLVLALEAVGTGVAFAQDLPPAKQAIQQQYDQERAVGQQNPAPRNPNAPYPIVPPTPFETGIFDDDCDSFHGVLVVNCWGGIVNNDEMMVWAGAQSQEYNPQQGVVIIFGSSAKNSVLTPIQAGAVRIVAARNNILTLVSANNAYALTFDVGTQAFTSVNPVGSAPTSGNACNGIYGGTFTGNINVSVGQNCVFVGGGVTGNIVETGGNLALSNATVGGSVQVNGGGTFFIGPSTIINGNLQIQAIPAGAAQNQVCATSVRGSMQYLSNGAATLIGSFSCQGNRISGDLQVQGNTGPTQVFNNTVTQNLLCQGNASITGGGNTASLKQGQCASF